MSGRRASECYKLRTVVRAVRAQRLPLRAVSDLQPFHCLAAQLRSSCTTADTSPYATLFLPLLVPAATNGWVWPQRGFPSPAPRVQSLHEPALASGLIDPNSSPSSHERGRGDGPGGKYVMGGGDDLTDDEGGGGGWWEDPHAPAQEW